MESLNRAKLSSREVAQPLEAGLAARVNGEAIYLIDLQEGVQRFKEFDPGAKSGDQKYSQQVLEGLIDQALLSQAAQAEGIVIANDILDLRIEEMKRGQTVEQFNNWLAINNYTQQTFREALRAQLTGLELYDRIATRAPTTAEQIHARHILLQNSDEAPALLLKLQAGASFAQLAQNYSTDAASALNGGDLGWFPRGVGALPPEAEEVAFSLAAKEFSPVIESALGYHIIKVELKAPNRALTPQHRRILQVDFFGRWLAGQRATAQIERYTN